MGLYSLLYKAYDEERKRKKLGRKQTCISSLELNRDDLRNLPFLVSMGLLRKRYTKNRKKMFICTTQKGRNRVLKERGKLRQATF